MILSFEANNHEELRAKVLATAQAWGWLTQTTSPAQMEMFSKSVGDSPVSPDHKAQPMDEKAKRGRKPKADQAAEETPSMPVESKASEVESKASEVDKASAPVSTPAQASPAQAVQTTSTQAKVLTKEDVIAAVANLNNAKGLETARQALLDFGVQRVSELKETDYVKFVAHVNSRL